MEHKTLTLTVESKIYNPSEDLEQYAFFYSFLYRKLFNIIRNNENTLDRAKLKREFSAEHKIPVRLFNALYTKCMGEIQSVRALEKERAKEIQYKIDNLSKKRIPNKTKKHNLKCKINKLKQRLENLINKSKVNIVFGTKALYKKQWNTKSHDEWLSNWKRCRNHILYFIGSSDENFGNAMAQLQTLNNLRLTLPESFENKHLYLDVDFTHEAKPYRFLQYAREIKRPLTYNIQQKENGNWYVQVTFSLEIPIVKSINGNIGIDVNHDLIATSETDAKGNFIGFKQYKFETENKSSEQITQILSDICTQIISQAKKNNKNIIIEDLKLCKKKTENRGKKTNKKLNMLIYSKFFQLLKSKAIKNQIIVDEVNPAYTSIIGKYKYMKVLGINTHTSASFVIARRGLDNIKTVEKVPSLILNQVQCGQNDLVSSWKTWNQINKSVLKSFPELKKGISFKRLHLLNEHTPKTDNSPHLNRSCGVS